MGIRIDSSDLDRFVLKLDKAVSQAPQEATKVVERGALNIKRGAQSRVQGMMHAPAYPSAYVRFS